MSGPRKPRAPRKPRQPRKSRPPAKPAKRQTGQHSPGATGPRDYQVGRGKPPVEHQWKPGQSGNDRGRPKGRKNEATIWKELLGRKITINIGGKPKKVTLLEAILYRIVGDAAGGKIKSAEFVLKRSELTMTGANPVSDLNDDDRAVLDDFVRRLKDEI